MEPNQDAPEIRAVMYERFYPGSVEQLNELFGTLNPGPGPLFNFKKKWAAERTGVCIESKSRLEVQAITKSLGIHPFFWTIVEDSSDVNSRMYRMERIVFYDPEHEVIFKMAMDV